MGRNDCNRQDFVISRPVFTFTATCLNHRHG